MKKLFTMVALAGNWRNCFAKILAKKGVWRYTFS